MMPCCVRNKRICRSLLSSEAPGTNPHVDLEDDGVADEWLVKEPRSKASLEPSILTDIYRLWNPLKRDAALSLKVSSAFSDCLMSLPRWRSLPGCYGSSLPSYPNLGPQHSLLILM